jgi:DNA-binding IclR family transcriptional regulator
VHLARLINLLEIISVAGRPLTAAEICSVTDLPKPTCYRLLQTLLSESLIEEPSNDGRYIVGERLIRIALLGKSDVDVRRVSSVLLKAAATKFNETTFLSRFRDSKVEIIHVETPDDPSRAFIHPGMGERPIAAFADAAFMEKILAGTLKAYTQHTKTTREMLMVEFELIRNQGYADCDQEIDVGIASVAAPITMGNIGAIFSVGAVGPIRRFDKEYRKEIGIKLTKLAEQISDAIQLCNVAEV